MSKHISLMLQKFCQTLCADLFVRSYEQCLDKATEIDPANASTPTHAIITAKKLLSEFCQAHKDRFWLLYYRHAQKKIAIECRKCGVQADNCQAYVLDRIEKPMQTFDEQSSSEIFLQVRRYLQDSEPKCDEATEIVRYYCTKIKRRYTQQPIEYNEAEVLLDTALQACHCQEHTKVMKQILNGYKIYSAKVVLKELVDHTAQYTSCGQQPLSYCVYDGLINQEKFIAYISKVIKHRVIDFTRSRVYSEVVSDEITEKASTIEDSDEIESESEWIDLLSEEQALIYKLKYGLKLNNREFLTLFYRLDYKVTGLVDMLSNEEKFYIQMISKYGLEDDSTHLYSLDVASIKASLEKKIARYKERLLHSASHRSGDSEKEEIFLKLLYREPLSAREIGVIFGLRAKQVDKKIENSKKKIQRSL